MVDDLKKVIEDSFEEALTALAKETGTDIRELKTIMINIGDITLYNAFKEIYCKGMNECGRIAYLYRKEPTDIQSEVEQFRKNRACNILP
jgi:hypothetical protein